MKNSRNRIDVIKTKLFVTEMFDKDLFAIRQSKVRLILNSTAYVGMCVLDLSKILMYEFHYDYVKHKCGKNSKLLFIDTNSLMHEIKTKDVYEDSIKDKEILDCTNYSTKSKYYDNSYKLVVGKIKYETAGDAIKEFVELKPK